MAASVTKHKSAVPKESIKNGLALMWLDDSADQDPSAKEVFQSLFEHVLTFADPGACLEVVESAESATTCISVLISGKYGQMLVPNRLQGLPQVKDIYVYCFDINKHNQWAQKCDKVRCVESDLGKIFKHIQHDVQKVLKQRGQTTDDQHEQEPEVEELIEKEFPHFLDDNNFHDELACNLLVENSTDDGVEDFKKFCQTNLGNNQDNEEDRSHEEQQPYFQPNVPIKEWYKRDLCFVHLNSTNTIQLWTLRWFIKLFYKQLTNEYKTFMHDKTTLVVNYGTWLTEDELNAMKFRIGEYIIFTEIFTSYVNRNQALNAIKDEKNEQRKHKVIFEINTQKDNGSVPYTEIKKNEVLFWFGSRHRIMKIEYSETQGEHPDSYWLITVNLSSTLDQKKSILTLYDYYRKELTMLKDLHHAFGRILMYKGLYYEAEKWFQNSNHHVELAELAIRQNQFERANQYLQLIPEDSNDGNLLRAYALLLSPNDNAAKGRTILIQVSSDATEKLIRARVNIALGIVSLMVSQQTDQALDYFNLGSQALCKLLPDIHPDVAKAYIGLGYAHYAKKDINEAEKYFQMALTIQNQFLPTMHPDLAKTRSALAHCLSLQKKTIVKAYEELQMAYNILMHTFPRENKKHPEIFATTNDIDRLKKGKELPVRNTLLDYI